MNCEQMARNYGKEIKLSYDGKALKMFPRSDLPTDLHCVHCARKAAMKEWYEDKSKRIENKAKFTLQKSTTKKYTKEEYYQLMVVERKAVSKEEFVNVWENVIKRRQG